MITYNRFIRNIYEAKFKLIYNIFEIILYTNVWDPSICIITGYYFIYSSNSILIKLSFMYVCIRYPLSYQYISNPCSSSIRHVHVMINVLKRPIQRNRRKTNGKNCLDEPFHADALINRHRVFREGSTKNEGYKWHEKKYNVLIHYFHVSYS